MSLYLNGYEGRVEQAVDEFWAARQGGSGVRAGKTMDGFVDVLKWVVRSNGLPDATFYEGGIWAEVPGFFRSAKRWDLLVMNGETLVAAIEFKSIADSFGNNANNRGEEAAGCAVDVLEALREGAFDGLTKIFLGYLMLVEDCNGTNQTVKVRMKNFRVMAEFMLDPTQRDTTYVRRDDGFYPPIDGVSYMSRFDIMCRRLMQKQMYDAACVVAAKRPPLAGSPACRDVSRDTGVKAFLAGLAAHVSAIVAIAEG